MEEVQNAGIRARSLGARNRAARCQNGKFYRKSFNYPSRLGTIEMHTLPKELNPYCDSFFYF